ncbi:hypothetical protein AAF712_005213 [Marasmius tenuissimus]|uniref:Enoyl reductase (ER) domain-containing protein n=1 Tax=Marasmius tenuissimus TaxID=585030 RepID=A0ABR3A451_9AGAR|nr:hypothetical protein PM082_022488 [Marasmius tenuissimus]
MSQQKALAFLTPESGYKLITKPIPVPGPAEVLIKIESAALQPLEWQLPLIPALFDSLNFPAPAGADGAGVVESVGSNVKGIQKGDRVLFQGWLDYDYATFQEYALAPEIFVAKLPSSISTLEGSSLPTAVISAAVGFSHPDPATPSPTDIARRGGYLFENRAGVGIKPFWEDGAEGSKAGEPILVLGGSSSVGQLVIQIAKYLGFSPIITTSSLRHADYLKSLGATHVLDRAIPEESLASAVRAATHKQIEVAYDAVGAISQTHIDLLGFGGGFILADPEVFDRGLKFDEGKKPLIVGGVAHGFKEFGASMFENLESFLERGIIKPLRVEKLPGGLNGIVNGLSRLQKNEVSGVKLVVDPRETA